MSESNPTSSADPLFETAQKAAVFEIWDQMQRIQTDFAIAQELTFYYTSPQWARAQTVLDLGTGNGYYLRHLINRFPEKTYYGFDSSVEFINVAKQEHGDVAAVFSSADLFEVRQTADFVLMRLLLQHVQDVDAVLNHVASLTSIGGSALIVDAHDPFRHFHPPLPEFRDFFAAYTGNERQSGRDRRVSAKVAEAIAASDCWRQGDTLQLLIPSTIPGNLELFTRTYLRLVDLVEQVGQMSYDFEMVRAAWRRWSQRPDAYTQVGLNLIRIDRI